jgi:K+-transporting ATPase KdpF subunit
MGEFHGFLAGSCDYRLLSRRDWLYLRVRQAQIGVHMNLENILMVTISFLLMVYLIYALLRPEKF